MCHHYRLVCHINNLYCIQPINLNFPFVEKNLRILTLRNFLQLTQYPNKIRLTLDCISSKSLSDIWHSLSEFKIGNYNRKKGKK